MLKMFFLAQIGFFLGILFWVRAHRTVSPRLSEALGEISSFLTSPCQSCLDFCAWIVKLRGALALIKDPDFLRPGFSPIDGPAGIQQAVEISYVTPCSQKEKIVFPFKRRHVSRMLPFTAKLQWEGGEMDITQAAGLPYLASACQLGGDRIVVTSSDSGDSVSFDKDEAPGYVEGLE